MEEKLETRCFYTWRTPNGIIRTVVKPDSVIELDDAKENVECVGRLAKGQQPGLIVEMTGIKSISKEARRYFSASGRESQTGANAIVANSPVTKMIGNFFMAINKPSVPTRLVSNVEEGEKWIIKTIGFGGEK